MNPWNWESHDRRQLRVLVAGLILAFAAALFIAFYPIGLTWLQWVSLGLFAVALVLVLWFLCKEDHILRLVFDKVRAQIGDAPEKAGLLRQSLSDKEWKNVVFDGVELINSALEAHARFLVRRNVLHLLFLLFGSVAAIVSASLVVKQIEIQSKQLSDSNRQAAEQQNQFYQSQVFQLRQQLFDCGNERCGKSNASWRSFVVKSLIAFESASNSSKFVDLSGSNLDFVSLRNVAAKLDLHGASLKQASIANSSIPGTTIPVAGLEGLELRSVNLACLNSSSSDGRVHKIAVNGADFDMRGVLLCGAQLGPHKSQIPKDMDNIVWGVNWKLDIEDSHDPEEGLDRIGESELRRIVENCPASMSRELLAQLAERKQDLFGSYEITEVRAESCGDLKPGVLAAKLGKKATNTGK